MRTVGLAALAVLAVGAVADDTDTALDLTVMTFNLRYASNDGPNAWSLRRPVMRAVIQRAAPDLFGTQEGVYHQLRDLHADLPGYDWIGLGRDGRSRGEFMAVFYRTDRLEPVAFDHFWLSDTPEVVGSSTWGNTNRRMVTWVRFREKATGREFFFWNTHFDHALQEAREKSAALVLERIAALDEAVPLLLVGDFNALAGENPIYHTLVTDGPFTDAWTTAGERGPELDTFHGFDGPQAQGRRIDWILFRGPFEVLRADALDDNEEGRYPSDHLPVVARMRLR